MANKWECTICGYIYNPDERAPNGRVKPGTALKDLPESWICLLCGVPKNRFKEINN